MINRLKREAMRSPQVRKHAAAVVIGSKIITTGVNNDKNCVKTGTPCQHAERRAIERAFGSCLLWREEERCVS